MPTNLPAQYYAAEKVYKNASTPAEKVAALEEMLAIMPHHKGTDKLRAGLNRRIAQLKLQEESKSKTRHGSLYSIEKQGAAQLILTGLPNTGKSSILDALTHATPDIADYPFTTAVPVIGMMEYEDIQIQIVDLPPMDGEIRKLPYYNLLRNSDAHLMVLDGSGDPAVEARLILDELAEGKVLSALHEGEVPVGAVRKKILMILNKCDLAAAGSGSSDGAGSGAGTVDSVRTGTGTADSVRAETAGKIEIVEISIKEKLGLDNLKDTIYRLIDIIRVYTKVPHHPPDMKDPYVLPRGATVMDLAVAIHHDFADNLKFCCVWGSSKFDGQQVHRDHVLQDGDIVELHI